MTCHDSTAGVIACIGHHHDMYDNTAGVIACIGHHHDMYDNTAGVIACIGHHHDMYDNTAGVRAANQYGISVVCTDFTCKIREYEFGLENTEIELCQFCHLKYCCQNKAYLFWVANQSGFVAFYALEPSNTSLITKTFNLLSSTCSSSMLSCLTSCSCSTGSIH